MQDRTPCATTPLAASLAKSAAGIAAGTLLLLGCATAPAAKGDRPTSDLSPGSEPSVVSTPSRVVLRDRTADVWRQDVTGAARITRVRGHASEDVLRVTAKYTATAVEVTFEFRDLQPQPHSQQTFVASILTPGRRFNALVFVGPRGQGDRHTLLDFGRPAFGNSVGCAGFTHEVDFSADELTMRVPRSCLRNPPWIQLRFSNYTADLANGTVFLDNPHNARAEPGSARTPRLIANQER